MGEVNAKKSIKCWGLRCMKNKRQGRDLYIAFMSLDRAYKVNRNVIQLILETYGVVG